MRLKTKYLKLLNTTQKISEIENSKIFFFMNISKSFSIYTRQKNK